MEGIDQVLRVFLNLSKTFDSVDRNMLLDKIEAIGGRGLPLKLFTRYLSDKRQAVLCNNNVSNLKTIVKGVPQGSTLGPILFFVYVNDICNAGNTFGQVAFADDINILLVDNSLYNLHVKLNHELRNIFKWVSANEIAVYIF